MKEQLSIAGTDEHVTVPEPTDDELRERRRLQLASERAQEQRHDELMHEGEQYQWRRRSEEAARLRGLTPEQRHAEDAARAEQDRVQAAVDYAEMIDCLVLDAERTRAYLALHAAGTDRTAKLASVCAEIKADCDPAMWSRWCALAGMSVEQADEFAALVQP